MTLQSLLQNVLIFLESYVFMFYIEELEKTVFLFIFINGSIFNFGLKFPSFVCLWKCYLNTNFDISFQKLKIIMKKFHDFYLVEMLTCRSQKQTDRGADFLSSEDPPLLFHWPVSVGRCSAGNLVVLAYIGTATPRLVKSQGLPLGSNSNTTEW